MNAVRLGLIEPGTIPAGRGNHNSSFLLPALLIPVSGIWVLDQLTLPTDFIVAAWVDPSVA